MMSLDDASGDVALRFGAGWMEIFNALAFSAVLLALAFLAVITAPQSLTIQPYNRLMRELGLPFDELLGKLEAAGFDVR
ncbi:MAG TPA: hypothetical protein VFX31_08025, partial [Ktedonobacterales bacterium]|nr:hypothetical protein [Ktedonobacterales bacterium]